MNSARSLAVFVTLALGLSIPAQASACRIGWDQHLFEASPSPQGLADSRIIQVRFSNTSSAVHSWPKQAANPDGDTLPYTLIGVAQADGTAGLSAQPFPVYAFVTSCSIFSSMDHDDDYRVVEGEYYIVGRFVADSDGSRFYAAGRRVGSGGNDLYGGWHH